MRLIDADAFDRALASHEFSAALNEAADNDGPFKDMPMYYSAQSFRDTMRCRPTIDAVPVVRCKDCIYWDKRHTEECDNLDSVCFHNGWCKPNWFCADGKRRDDEGGPV